MEKTTLEVIAVAVFACIAFFASGSGTPPKIDLPRKPKDGMDFAAVSHEWHIKDEREAKRYLLLFMKLIGADISGERQSGARPCGRGASRQDGHVRLRVQVRQYGPGGAGAGEDEGVRQPVA